MWLYLNGRGQALQENDGRRIRERLLVRDRDQRVCADDRDSAREQAPQGRTPKVDQALSRNRQGRSSYEATPDQVRGKGRRTGPASRPSDRSLHEQQGNKRLPRARGAENRPRAEA